MNSNAPIIFFTVCDQFLESGSESSFRLDKEGGSLGSSEIDNWQIQDDQYNVQPNHVIIKFVDGMFCAFALHPIYINGAYFNADNNRVGLRTDDTIEIGKIKIKVNVHTTHSEYHYLVNSANGSVISSREHSSTEPLDNISQPTEQSDYPANFSNNSYIDPLSLLSSEQLTSEKDIIDLKELSVVVDGGKYDNTMSYLSSSEEVFTTKFIDLPNSHSDNSPYIDPKLYINSFDSHLNKTSNNKINENHNVYLNPLIKHIDPNLDFKNSKQVYDFLEEVGKTINEVISGILAIERNVHIADTQLRPLEDNPLRLAMDYHATVDMLFSETKSPVHLSAHTAVAETLNNYLLHQEANILAIETALQVLLEAFAPDKLENRFKKYKKAEDVLNEHDPRWIWEMFRKYYEELISSRQKGFKKLFKEVYDQVYDRELRRLQQGN